MRFCTFVLAITGVAWAGGCTETPTRDAFHSATLVFEGRVEKVEPVGGYTLHSHELDLQQPLTGAPAVVTFETTRMWKGKPGKVVKVVVQQKPVAGGEYRFQVGHEYVVYTGEASTWDLVLKMSTRIPVYDLGGDCPLRIRSDVAAEARTLGESKLH